MTDLTTTVLSLLVSTHVLPNGQEIKGQSISYISQELRDLGWKGVSNLNDLESTLESLGFSIVTAQGQVWNNSRKPGASEFKLGSRARVVTL